MRRDTTTRLMPLNPGPLPLPIPHVSINAAFDPTGAYFVAANRVFTSNDVFFELRGYADVVASLFHPKRPVLAQLGRSGTIELVELDTKKQTSFSPEGAAEFAFSPGGDLLAVSSWGSARVRLFNLEGQEQPALVIPQELMTQQPPALTFSEGAIIAWPSHDTRVVLPLDGGPPSSLKIPKVKLGSPEARWRTLALPTGQFLHDFNAWRLISPDGELINAGRGQFDGAVAIPGTGRVARLKLSKKTIEILDPASAEVVASAKVKTLVFNSSFACSSTLFSCTGRQTVELVALPPG